MKDIKKIKAQQAVVNITEWIANATDRGVDYRPYVKEEVETALKRTTKKAFVAALKKDIQEDEYWTIGEIRFVEKLLKEKLI